MWRLRLRLRDLACVMNFCKVKATEDIFQNMRGWVGKQFNITLQNINFENLPQKQTLSNTFPASAAPHVLKNSRPCIAEFLC